MQRKGKIIVKRKRVWKRVISILLAGILMVESSMISLAESATVVQTEIVEQSTQDQTEEMTDEMILEENTVLEFEQSTPSTSIIESTVEETKEIESSEIVETNVTEIETSEETSVIESDTTEESNIEVNSTENETEEMSSEIEQETVSETMEVSEDEATLKTEVVETEEENLSIELEQNVYNVQDVSEEIELEFLAPKNLEITDKMDTSITLQWDTIIGCTEYAIYRSETKDNGYEQLLNGKVSTDSNRGAYTDTTCEEGKVYYYKVRGYRQLPSGTVVYSGFSNIVDNRIVLETISLDKAECEIVLGKTDLITIFFTPENTTDKDKISFSISDEEVIAVDSIDEKTNTVTIYANQVGESELTIQVGDCSASCHITVVADEQHNTQIELVPVQEVIIDATLNNDVEEGVVGAINLEVGSAEKSSVTLKAEVLPEDATNKQIQWTSSDKDVVLVSEDGVVTATGVGTAIITATADNDVCDKVTIVVLPLDQEFRIQNEKNITLYCNEIGTSTSALKREHQVKLTKELTYTYQSSKPDVASINEEGLITAHAPGVTTITVRAKETGKLASMTVTVRRYVEKIILPKNEITVMRGTIPKIAFSLTPQNVSAECLETLQVESSRKILSLLTWTKKKTSGEISFRADKVGTATLKITAGDHATDVDGEPINSVYQEIVVHVVEPNATKIATAKLNGQAKMKSGTVQQLELCLWDSTRNELDLNEIGVSVGYVSSNEAIATVDENGKVTALTGGRVVITAYILDGSNKKVTLSINVEQRPEEIAFEKDTYYLSKATNATANISLKPLFYPATTASNHKGVQWQIVEVRNADGTLAEGEVSAYAVVNTSGVVTVKKNVSEGMYLVVRCTSKSYDATEQGVSADVKIIIQERKVSQLRFKTTNVQMIGLEEMSVPFIPTYVKGYSDATFDAVSSNPEIVEVLGIEDDFVRLKAKAYGTVTITLSSDSAVRTTCRITVYPFVRGAIKAKQSTYTLQQAQYDATDKAELRFVDAQTQKIEVNPQLFTYQSSNPDLVYVDENGVAYANPKSDNKITESKNQVTITATLKNDPDKRKAVVKVIVCPTKQIERMDVTYYRTPKLANADTSYSDGTVMTDQGTTMVYDTSSREFVLRIFAYGADYESVSIPNIKASTSDTTVAMITSFRLKRTNGIDVWEAIVSVRKPGRFKVTFTAQDQKKKIREVAFGIYSGDPILESANVGCINKHAETVQINHVTGLISQETFSLIGTDGTEIKDVSVKSAQIKLKQNGKIVSRTYNCEEEDYFRVEALGNQKYRLVIYKDILENAVDGTYNITLNVKRSSLPGDVGFGSDKVKTITSTYKIVSTLPKIANATVRLNSFMKGDAVEIPIKTTETIQNVSVANGMMMDKEVDIFQENGKWYVKIKDDKFDTWKKSMTSGKIQVELAGYTTPVQMNLTVQTVLQKPTVKQQSVPSIQLQHGADTYVTLIDQKNVIWSDLEVSCKNEEKSVFRVEVVEGNKLKVSFKDATMKLRAQGTTYTEKVVVNKPEWKTPIEIAVSVKAYNGTTIPQIKFAKSTLQLNKYVGETQVETDVICSMNNVELTNGEWKIVETCRFATVENRKTVWHPCSDAFQAKYQGGKLKIVLKNPDIVPNGTYSLIMTKVWDEKNDESLKTPLKTSTLVVQVKNVAPVIRVSMSGRMDLINRSNSTLKGKVTVANVNSTIKRIKLVNDGEDGFAEKFYCIQKGQEFTVYARRNVELAVKRVTGTVELTMTDGTILRQKIAFTPTQSTPKVSNVANQTIYKSIEKYSKDIDFNQMVESGVQVGKIDVTGVPKGMSVQESNGHLLISLTDKTIKAGRYRMTVKIHFKGAQAISSDALGQAVTKTFYVDVKE